MRISQVSFHDEKSTEANEKALSEMLQELYHRIREKRSSSCKERNDTEKSGGII